MYNFFLFLSFAFVLFLVDLPNRARSGLEPMEGKNK